MSECVCVCARARVCVCVYVCVFLFVMCALVFDSYLDLCFYVLRRARGQI